MNNFLSSSPSSNDDDDDDDDLFICTFTKMASKMLLQEAKSLNVEKRSETLINMYRLAVNKFLVRDYFVPYCLCDQFEKHFCISGKLF